MNETAPRPVRLALLGGGAVSRIFHVPAIIRAWRKGFLELKYLVEPSDRAVGQIRELPQGTEIFRGPFESFLSSSRPVDAAIIALPHHLHEPAVCSAMAEGLHVLCEKQLAISQESLSKMLEARDRSGAVLAAGQMRRYGQGLTALKSIIDNGPFGRCLSVSWSEGGPYAWPLVSFAAMTPGAGGDILFDTGAHILDTLAWFFGPLTVTRYSDDSRGGLPATCELELRSADGLIQKVSMSRVRQMDNEAVFVFERATVLWRPESWNTLEVKYPDLTDISSEWKLKSAQPLDFNFLFDLQLSAFVQAAQNGNFDGIICAEETSHYINIFDECMRLRAHAPAPQRVKKVDSRSFASYYDGRSVAITGPAGFIGHRLFEIFWRESSAGLRPLVHRPSSCAELARYPVQLYSADIMDLEKLLSALDKADVVFHCAYGGESQAAVTSSIVEGTSNVLKASIERGVRRLVVLSSNAAYGVPPEDGIVDESSTSRKPLNAYAEAKLEMEQFLMKEAFSGNIEVVILEPTCVFGPRGATYITGPLERMRSGDFFLIEEGRGRANLIYVDNLVDAMLLAGNAPGIAGKRFIVNEDAEETVTWARHFGILRSLLTEDLQLSSVSRRDFNREIREATFAKRPLQIIRQAVRRDRDLNRLVTKSLLFRTWLSFKELLKKEEATAPAPGIPPTAKKTVPLCLNLSPWADPAVLNLYDSQAIFSSNAFRLATGWKPSVNYEEAMQRTLAWVVENRTPK